MSRDELRAAFAPHLRDARHPTVLVTHDPVDARTLADRVVVLEQGRVTQAGTWAAPRQCARDPLCGASRRGAARYRSIDSPGCSTKYSASIVLRCRVRWLPAISLPATDSVMSCTGNARFGLTAST